MERCNTIIVSSIDIDRNRAVIYDHFTHATMYALCSTVQKTSPIVRNNMKISTAQLFINKSTYWGIWWSKKKLFSKVILIITYSAELTESNGKYCNIWEHIQEITSRQVFKKRLLKGTFIFTFSLEWILDILKQNKRLNSTTKKISECN